MESIKRLLLLFILLEIAFAIVLEYSYASSSLICLPGFDCKAVQDSQYGQIFGVKLSTIGLIAFPALLLVFVISLKHERLKPFYLASTAIGALGAISFLYIQFFLIGKVCSSCLSIDSLMIVIFLISIYDFFKNR